MNSGAPPAFSLQCFAGGFVRLTPSSRLLVQSLCVLRVDNKQP